ncbi:RagB/SusD family nutrient uptake outer membrane protein [Marinifilum sp. D714]|uniref:RagB/SusD family nutrient uptake outer membrane protein n=1 Tax=Marinifilum sp. D714 TaxID=2937523 RepID=UPI0027D1B06F|nr:RagB/SusD family nutrient uptake outer membrane protein [Marinifilum sp. D714]MDQ2177172.1 RagB/SusD family nutrient uptake outer membrane protein [Marinifilum sp. D714]
MKQILTFITIFSCFLLLTSCNDWLDVTPQGDAEAEELLSTTAGVNSAVAGLYYNLIQTNSHAGDLSFGTLDVLAQYYEVSDVNHQDYYFAQYDYNNIRVKSRINSWWKNYYLSVAQANQILSELDNNSGNIDTPELFEGELLALRAFIHLQVYQLFGPVVQNQADLEQKAIPYRYEFNELPTEFLTCEQVLTNAKNDLLKALELLENDPIRKGHKRLDNNESMLAYNNILANRVGRLNYFAVMGMLVRVEQLLLNQSETDGAFYWANRIVKETESGDQNIAFTTKEEVEGSGPGARDLLYSSEIIFSLHINNLYKVAGKKFSLPGYNGKQGLMLTVNSASFDNFVNYVYGREPDGAGTDYRLNYWFNQNSGSSNFPFQKYREPEDQNKIYKISYPEVAVLRLSEIYYAMCESKINVDNVKALEYLNEVRTKRGLPELDNSEADNVAIYLMRERRKEFMGDGRTFLINKRLFTNIEASSSLNIEASKAIFELPIPEDEFTYGPEEKSSNN